MSQPLIFLSMPGLRRQDVAAMRNLAELMSAGDSAVLSPSFPCVTWPVQANMLTGCLPREHGVMANGFYWRDEKRIEMWTAWNETITAPQIWDRLHEHDPPRTSAVWFPMLSKGCGADYVCMPAPIHNPDGSESLWCYTKPTELYGTLRDELGHFPLKHFWGPLAKIVSSAWIADSAAYAARQYRPDFFYIYLPHLDYAAQREGPDSPAARASLGELDAVIGRLIEAMQQAYEAPPIWMAATEYVITEVDHVLYPNRQLREAGLLVTKTVDGGEWIDLEKSYAWAMVDHQLSHVFVRDRDKDTIREVVRIFSDAEGVAEVLAGEGREKYAIDHERAGDMVLISEPNSWQSYYYWNDDRMAPAFARTVDIHRKPGYDPVELHLDLAAKSIPLDATLIKGSHGAPAKSDAQRGVLLASQKGVLPGDSLRDTDVAETMLRCLTG